MSAALDRKLEQAAAALASGDLQRAEHLSRVLLERAPRHPRALELAAAVRLRQEDGAGASELLQRALASDPHNPRLLEGLGAAALKAKNFVEAESWLRRALSLGKRGAAALTWFGLALSAQGRRSEAAEIFREATLTAPNDPGMHLNLAHELARADKWGEAISSYKSALRLRPDLIEALNGLGSVLKVRGSLEEAVEQFRRAITARPDYAEAHDNLGATLLQLERYEEAETAFRRAIALEPDNADYQSDLGHALSKLGKWGEAMAQYERALALRPDFPEALNSKGTAFLESGRPEAAVVPVQQAIALRPDYAEAYDNLANALLRMERDEQANASFQAAIALQPGKADRYLRFGNALAAQFRWDDAIAQYERALALEPDLADAHFGIGEMRLFRQEFDLAWPGYERRHEATGYRKRYFREHADVMRQYERLRRWRGPSEPGVRDVAIWAEQAIGDQTLFSTLIPELLGSGALFTYEIDRRLMAVYQRAFPAIRFVPKQTPPMPEMLQAGRVLAIGSLPSLYRRSRESFARQPAKLLAALPERVAHYRQRFEALGSGLTVALSWKSSRPDWWVAKKTAPLVAFATHLKLPGVQLVDVQYGDTASERQAVEAAAGVRLARFEEVDYLNDLEEVLAILEASDLVITTSNATAHFAGALGKRTWLLYLADHPPFHYWAHGGSYRCLWYPSVEIVTASDLTDWPVLVQHVGERLARELESCEPGRDGSRPAAG